MVEVLPLRVHLAPEGTVEVVVEEVVQATPLPVRLAVGVCQHVPGDVAAVGALVGAVVENVLHLPAHQPPQQHQRLLEILHDHHQQELRVQPLDVVGDGGEVVVDVAGAGREAQRHAQAVGQQVLGDGEPVRDAVALGRRRWAFIDGLVVLDVAEVLVHRLHAVPDRHVGQLKDVEVVERGHKEVEGLADHGKEDRARVHQLPHEGAVVDGVLHQQAVAAAGRAVVEGRDGEGPAQVDPLLHGQHHGQVVAIAVAPEHRAQGLRGALHALDEGQVPAGPAVARPERPGLQPRVQALAPAAPDHLVDVELLHVGRGAVGGSEGQEDVQHAQQVGDHEEHQHLGHAASPARPRHCDNSFGGTWRRVGRDHCSPLSSQPLQRHVFASRA